MGADTLENEEEFYRNYQQNGNQITYNGRTVEYHRVDRPDGPTTMQYSRLTNSISFQLQYSYGNFAL
ncbi:MAG: hypothetical protein ACLSH6_01720 [Limosilactobacillus pontis]